MPKTVTKTKDRLVDVILGPVTLDLPPLVEEEPEEEPNKKIIELEEVITKIETDEDYFLIYNKKLKDFLIDNDFKHIVTRHYFWREREDKVDYIFLNKFRDKKGTHIFSIDEDKNAEFMKYFGSKVSAYKLWGTLGIGLGAIGGYVLGIVVGVNVDEYTSSSLYGGLSGFGTWISFAAASMFSGYSLDKYINKKRIQKLENKLKQSEETFNPYLKHSPDKYNFKLIKSFFPVHNNVSSNHFL